MKTVNNQVLRIAILIVSISLAGAVLAQQKSIQLPPDNPVSQLKPGPGVNLASLNCAICHSLDYIIRQPTMSAAQWSDEVRRMINRYGAPINETDAKTIADYLAASYGPQAAPPAKAGAAPVRSRN